MRRFVESSFNYSYFNFTEL